MNAEERKRDEPPRVEPNTQGQGPLIIPPPETVQPGTLNLGLRAYIPNRW